MVSQSRKKFNKEYLLIISGGIPKFKPTSSPELDSIFSNFRENVFLPAHLSKQHLDLVYAQKHQDDIETTPVTVNIAGEEFSLKHIDRTKDLLSVNDSVSKMLKLMTKSDWDNFPAFLEGMKSAGRPVSALWQEKSIRAASRIGRLDVILECVRRGADTGFKINTRSMASHILYWVQYTALADNFGQEKAKKALKMAEQIAALMEDQTHAGGKVRANDPRASPEVTGILLELSAINTKNQGGMDTDGSVEKYAKKFLATIRNNDIEGILDSTNAIGLNNGRLAVITPILYGVKTAASILDQSSETVTQLREMEKKLEAEVTKHAEASRASGLTSKALGVWSYEKIATLP